MRAANAELYAGSGDISEISNKLKLVVSTVKIGNSLRKGLLGIICRMGCKGNERITVKSHGFDRDDLGRAVGKDSGLVKNGDLCVGESLKSFGPLRYDPLPRAAAHPRQGHA